jgi:hypothetical protein
MQSWKRRFKVQLFSFKRQEDEEATSSAAIRDRSHSRIFAVPHSEKVGAAGPRRPTSGLGPPGDYSKRCEARLTGFEPVTVRLEEQWSFHNSLIFNGIFFPILPIFAIS